MFSFWFSSDLEFKRLIAILFLNAATNVLIMWNSEMSNLKVILCFHEVIFSVALQHWFTLIILMRFLFRIGKTILGKAVYGEAKLIKVIILILGKILKNCSSGKSHSKKQVCTLVVVVVVGGVGGGGGGYLSVQVVAMGEWHE